ncbi:ferritin-like domain-containing protein [Conexibacter sp. CPCC 206217]|uniref:ferritin-like domain-containing protein n=1 Tax=Conexibacter sp. CPCC 206217 TaxID=3064574 RepID=UPI002718BAE5|nr:ferritin-like domain-containing protein [Conexibacter sp. CPCC 206217]MDO8209187.1 ferritin-like domain-containing protein [Conexibacter sp. CPCC 206217]
MSGVARDGGAVSRRQLLAAAAAGGATVAAAGGGSALAQVGGGTALAQAGGGRALAQVGGATTLAQAGGDATVIAQALTLEQVAIASYELALRDGPPVPSVRRILRRFGAQERQHAEVLTSALDTLGGRIPPLPRSDAELARARERAGLSLPLDLLATVDDVARFAIELENAQLRLYLGAVRELGDGRMLAIATQITAAEGQHATVLRGLLSSDPAVVVPEPFETGDATIP